MSLSRSRQSWSNVRFSQRPAVAAKLDNRRIVNVVIAKDFNLAPYDVQIQGLEVRILSLFRSQC